MAFLSNLLATISGSKGMKISEQLLFDKVIGFKGIVGGVGTSTIVANTAIALSDKTNYTIGVLDLSFIHGGQYPLLFNSDDLRLIDKKVKKDLLDFNGDISEISIDTKYRNVYIIALNNRTIVDMLSTLDNTKLIERIINSMKSYYDIILIDLGNEFTNIATHGAIKCNKIFYVAEPSIRCTHNLRKFINTMVTLAVPLSKANKVIINKEIESINTGISKVLEDAGLNVLCSIPLSLDLAKAGVSGKQIWGKASKNVEISEFHFAIESIIEDIVQVTPLNKQYLTEDNTNNNSDNTISDDLNDELMEEIEVTSNENIEEMEDDFIDDSDFIDYEDSEDFIEDDDIEL